MDISDLLPPPPEGAIHTRLEKPVPVFYINEKSMRSGFLSTVNSLLAKGAEVVDYFVVGDSVIFKIRGWPGSQYCTEVPIAERSA